MTVIRHTTEIKADPKIVFDLSRDIDFHTKSTEHTNEKAIAGKTSGLIELGESVTWQAKHFGFNQKLTIKVTEFKEHSYFVDELTKGIFKRFRHEHHFKKTEYGTEMTDIFDFSSPFGYLGKLADSLFLKSYMSKFLIIRNTKIKRSAESNN
jgi:ligand-binding SRPBCC domain-containing protein